MSHQAHDHSSHGHDHHDDDHGHDHSDEVEPALQTLIWKQIEFEKIRTLNESEPDAGAKIVEKSWPQRLNPEPELASDSDEQLLMFAGTLKLHSVLIRSSNSSSAPKTLHLFLNKDDLDFSSAADTNPTQTLTLSQTSDVQEIPVKRALFGNTYSLTLFVEDNYGDDVSRVSYLGFKGEFTRLSREPVEVLYERAANPRDHAPIVGTGGILKGVGRHGM
ncbi:hypothetical protein MMC07_005067 [Pseudocyphellaria aurata]|nr:hypothetical protein [Pseudocyphellaria aurata]